MRFTTAPVRRPRLALVAVLVAFAFATVVPLATPAPTRAATTAQSMEGKILAWVNAARAERGVPALQLRGSLVELAGDRAAKMVSTNELEHPKCLSCKLNKRHIPWHTCGETIAWTSWPWGTQAAQSIFNGWKNSPGHWSLLMSPNYDHVGIGVAYRKSNHRTYAAAVLTGW